MGYGLWALPLSVSACAVRRRGPGWRGPGAGRPTVEAAKGPSGLAATVPPFGQHEKPRASERHTLKQQERPGRGSPSIHKTEKLLHGYTPGPVLVPAARRGQVARILVLALGDVGHGERAQVPQPRDLVEPSRRLEVNVRLQEEQPPTELLGLRDASSPRSTTASAHAVVRHVAVANVAVPELAVLAKRVELERVLLRAAVVAIALVVASPRRHQQVQEIPSELV
eukprot:4021807-Alexandrium_andersonii.AAC.1